MKRLAIAALAALLLAAHCDECGPTSPTGPCETACKPEPCKPGSYCCAPQEGDDFGGCCLTGDTCKVDADGPYCEGQTGPIEIVSASRRKPRR